MNPKYSTITSTRGPERLVSFEDVVEAPTENLLSELMYLENTISCLEDSLCAFADRLSPVLRMDSPRAESSNKEAPRDLSQVEYRVEQARKRINEITNGVDSLRARTAL